MASNNFGNIFKVTTWGESHGKAVGAVIDGCPSGILISEEEINQLLLYRSPGRTEYTSQRVESDSVQILSGVYEGMTTGAPISIVIYNKDADSSKYTPIKEILRPGHANYTYLEKYGVFDYRGGGRSSARETACRVAASAFAKKILQKYGIEVIAYIKQIGTVTAQVDVQDAQLLRSKIYSNLLFCPDINVYEEMKTLVEQVKAQGDSIGGMVECICTNVPTGLGDPIYEKLEANLAHAMMTIPGSKGFEIGSGFKSVCMRGSEHNDSFSIHDERVITQTNNAGGTLGGISTGMPIITRIAFKPTSSIMQKQHTITTDKKNAVLELPQGSRHDPCIAIRAVSVVEAMASLTLVDALLLNRCAKI